MLTITAAAAEALRRDLAECGEEGDGVRVSAYTVGAHPELQYGLDFGPRREGDEVIELLGELFAIHPGPGPFPGGGLEDHADYLRPSPAVRRRIEEHINEVFKRTKVIGQPTVKVFIDPESLPHLSDTTLDHSEKGYRFVRG